MEQNQNNDDSKRNPTECSEGADQPLLGVVEGRKKNIISINLKENDYVQKKCHHNNISVSLEDNYVECNTCGIEINAVWWLQQQALRHSSLEWENRNLAIKLQETEERLKTKRRCRCEHCNKITRIRLQ